MNDEEKDFSRQTHSSTFHDQKLGAGKDIDAQRHPEEQVVDPNEFLKMKKNKNGAYKVKRKTK